MLACNSWLQNKTGGRHGGCPSISGNRALPVRWRVGLRPDRTAAGLLRRIWHFPRPALLAVSLLVAQGRVAFGDYAVNFENATNTTYAAATIALNGLNWQIGDQALIGTDANDMKNGARAARLRLNSSVYGSITMIQDKADGLGSISFLYARANLTGDRTGTSPSFVVEYSTNAGESWIQAGSETSLAGVDDLTTFSVNVNIEGNVRVRIRQTAGTTDKRWNVDDILLTDYVVAEPTPDAPVSLPAAATNVQGFAAAWEAVGGVTGYRLDVSTRNEFLPAGSTLVTNGFEGSWPPEGWTTSSVDQSAAQKRSGGYSAFLNATNDYLITPLVNRPAELRFWSYRTSETPTLIAELSASTDGPWTAVSGSPFGGATQQWNEGIAPLDNTAGAYVRFRKTGSTGNVYLDDVHIRSTQSDLVPGYDDRTIAGAGTVSAAVTGLVSGTAYFYRVRAAGETVVSGNSAIQSVTTLAMPAPSAVWTSATGALEFVANWDPVTEAAGYRLDVSTNDTFATFVDGYQDLDVGNVTSFTVSDVLAQTMYHYRVRAYDAGSTSANSATQSVTTTLKGEPTNHATGFAAPTVTHRTIILTWTDAVGATPPDRYLLRGSTNGFDAIHTPADGTPVANNTGWTGGLYATNVVQGVQSAELRGLQAERTYYFKLFPYANSHSLINYKTNGIVPELTVTTGIAPFEDFEGAIQMSYTTNTLALGYGNWLFHNALLGQTAPDKRRDQKAARIQGGGFLQMEFNTNFIQTVAVEHANFSTNTGGAFVMWVSTNAGTSWQQIGGAVNCGATLQTAVFTVHQKGNVRFQIENTGTVLINIDNIRTTPFRPTPSVFRIN